MDRRRLQEVLGAMYDLDRRDATMGVCLPRLIKSYTWNMCSPLCITEASMKWVVTSKLPPTCLRTKSLISSHCGPGKKGMPIILRVSQGEIMPEGKKKKKKPNVLKYRCLIKVHSWELGFLLGPTGGFEPRLQSVQLLHTWDPVTNTDQKHFYQLMVIWFS